MDLKERWEEIQKAMEAEDQEVEEHDDHDEDSGEPESLPEEETDEVTPENTGKPGEESGGESDVEVEITDGTPETPDEVEGYESDLKAEPCCPPEDREALEKVHGRDDRVRVNNTRRFPWRTICHLEIKARNGKSFICTGAFISPRVVLTAGHCIYMHGNGGWARNIRVIPGRNAGAEPYGSAYAERYLSVKGWTQKQKSTYDYGVIILPGNKKLGDKVGWMGLAKLSFASLMGLRVNNSGYPGDKPYGTQWWNANNILSVTARRFFYRIDTAGGQSGSPVWRYKDGKRHIIGIHTTGSSVWNGATRINKKVFGNLVKWKKL